MKEKLVNFMVNHKTALVRGSLVVGVITGAVVVGAIVLNRMTDPELLMDQIQEEANSEPASE